MQESLATIPDTLVTDLDEELIVIHGRSGKAYRFNGSARCLYLALPATREALVEHLLAVYDVSREQAEADVHATIVRLRESDLLAGPAPQPDS